jgi:hypothetical protein
MTDKEIEIFNRILTEHIYKISYGMSKRLKKSNERFEMRGVQSDQKQAASQEYQQGISKEQVKIMLKDDGTFDVEFDFSDEKDLS